MIFKITATEENLKIIFEPTAAEYELRKGKHIRVYWIGNEEGIIRVKASIFEVWAPSDGYTRAWEEDGAEIYIGPESE